MKRFSILAIVLTFSLSTLFTSCGNDNDDAKDAANEMIEEANKVTKEAVEEPAEANETADYSAGETIYKNKCMACHQENGEGVDPSFPALKGEVVDINIVVNGSKENPAMIASKDQLNDQEIVDVINYVNHAWGNNGDVVKIEDITATKK